MADVCRNADSDMAAVTGLRPRWNGRQPQKGGRELGADQLSGFVVKNPTSLIFVNEVLPNLIIDNRCGS